MASKLERPGKPGPSFSAIADPQRRPRLSAQTREAALLNMMPLKIEGADWLEDGSKDVSRGAAIASQSRQRTAALPPSCPFAVGRAGFDYFADQRHYSSLAGRVVARLWHGGRIALITGNPPISPLSFATALTEATAGKHKVLAIACGDDFNKEQLRRVAGLSPLLLFYQADRLSDGQLSRLCSYLVSSSNGPPGVLLGQAGLVARLEKLLRPHPFEDGRVIHFNFYELGRDEIDVFIRRQLCPGKTADAFSADAVNWIADLSTGDPAEVNRLSRLTLEFVGRADGTGPAGDSTSPHVPPPSAPRWRKAMSRLAPIGILLCLGISVLLTVTGGPELGRIGAPRESSSDGSFASEQTAASSPAAVAAANSAETTPLPAEPATAPASTETASPATEPAAAPASTETTPPFAAPATTPTSTEAAPLPTGPIAAANSAETTLLPTEAATAPAETAPPSLSAGPTAKRAETARPLPVEQIAMLLARGDAFMQARDIASARLLYERAADAGNGRAALRVGESFDPAFLGRIGVYRNTGDRRLALSWYRRARDLGDTEAAQLLERLESR